MKQGNQLSDHIAATYFTMRLGLVVVGFGFPIVLCVFGLISDIDLQTSMSAYYHHAPTRDIFVGVLFVAAGFLYAYKGFSSLENVLLNLAGVFAVGVALFPCDCPGTEASGKFSAHGLFAVLFFLCIAVVCVFCAKDTLKFVPDIGKQKMLLQLYRILGICMVISPGAAFVVVSVLNYKTHIVFFVEGFGIWVFAAYWLVKTWEMSLSHAEKDALRGRLPKGGSAEAGSVLSPDGSSPG